MPKFLRKPHPGYISSAPKPISTKNTRGTFSLRRPQVATYCATTAPVKKSTNTWTGDSSPPLLTRQHIMDLVASVSTSLASLSFIRNFGKLSPTLRRKTSRTLSSLHQTALYLNDLLRNLLVQELIRSSGAGDRKPSSRKRLRKG